MTKTLYANIDQFIDDHGPRDTIDLRFTFQRIPAEAGPLEQIEAHAEQMANDAASLNRPPPMFVIDGKVIVLDRAFADLIRKQRSS